ncbi:S8 family serine peptidase [Novosphingobium sp. B 225]|uniref:S8 family serine peptidase n=1 Tax=Novosphingobium sp. B 225 TaxID=1961849 RepID=UPI0020CF5A43|nr:S8 family serine peptidase [Novosphingobium sp. B 225]
MTAKRVLALAAVLAVSCASAMLAAHERDPETGSRAQGRLDRDLSRAAQRSDETSTRYAEERARIEQSAVREPDKAAEDLAKLDADFAKEQQKSAEDLGKIQEDFAKESTKEAEDAAEDAAEEVAELAERGDTGGSSGSSHLLRDLGQSEGAEHDEHGFPVRHGELVGVDLNPATVEAAQARGFRVIERQRLESLRREVIRISAPAGMTSRDAREVMRAIDPEAVIDLVHYYGLNLTAGAHGKRIKGGAPARRNSGALAVGVIDTAVHPHPGLGNSRLVAWRDGNQPGAPVAHGTAVASLIAGEGNATIYSANIFRGPASRPFTSADVIAQALEWTLAQGAPTINMSLAGPRNAILDRLIRDALASGHTIVAAAGNGGPTAPPAYPAAVPGVVAVTAVDKNLRIYRYANRGRYITVAAQGVDVVAANAPGGYARFTGTSFATPHVTGWLARCRSSGETAATCSERLRRSARDLGGNGFDETYGFGVID